MSALFQRSLVSVCLIAAAFCLWKAWPGLMGESGPFQSRLAHASSDGFSYVRADVPPARRRLRAMPIQDQRIGIRVVGRNPITAEADRDLPEPGPATWRLVRVRMELDAGKFMHAELLRPIEWIEDVGAGSDSTIRLELPEMFVEGGEGDGGLFGNDPRPLFFFRNCERK